MISVSPGPDPDQVMRAENALASQILFGNQQAAAHEDMLAFLNGGRRLGIDAWSNVRSFQVLMLLCPRVSCTSQTYPADGGCARLLAHLYSCRVLSPDDIIKHLRVPIL